MKPIRSFIYSCLFFAVSSTTVFASPYYYGNQQHYAAQQMGGCQGPHCAQYYGNQHPYAGLMGGCQGPHCAQPMFQTACQGPNCSQLLSHASYGGSYGGSYGAYANFRSCPGNSCAPSAGFTYHGFVNGVHVFSHRSTPGIWYGSQHMYR